jgi:hypothetical protein
MLSVIVCVFDITSFLAHNVYAFDEYFHIRHHFSIREPRTITGEHNFELLIETAAGLLVVDITGKFQRKIIIRYEKIKTDEPESTTRLGVPAIFRSSKAMLDTMATKTSITIVKSGRIVKIKHFFAIYRLENFGFVLKAQLVKVLDYSGEGIFLCIGEVYNAGKRFLSKDGRIPQDFYWDNQGNFYILELSPLYVEWLAVRVYDKARNFQQRENRILTGLDYASIQIREMVFPDASEADFAFIIDEKTIYLHSSLAQIGTDNQIFAIVKPCRDVENSTWRGELILTCALVDNSCIKKKYFFNRKRQLLVWSKKGKTKIAPIDVLIYSACQIT